MISLMTAIHLTFFGTIQWLGLIAVALLALQPASFARHGAVTSPVLAHYVLISGDSGDALVNQSLLVLISVSITISVSFTSAPGLFPAVESSRQERMLFLFLVPFNFLTSLPRVLEG